MGWRTLDQSDRHATGYIRKCHHALFRRGGFPEIDNLSAGIIFASNAEHSHYHMWQVNLEAGYPRFRPHIWRGPDLADATAWQR